jgi:hypothetical protein
VFKERQALLLQLALGASLLSFVGAAPAHANTYSFMFTGNGILGTSGSVTINATITTGSQDSANSLNSPAGYDIDISTITGTYLNANGDSLPISVLVLPGTCAPAPQCNTLATLFPPPPATPPQLPTSYVFYYPGSPTYFDTNGIVFLGSSAGDLVNLWSDGVNYYVSDCDSSSSCTEFDQAADFEGWLTITPLPGALPLLGSVLGGSYLVAGWRRRRRFSSAGARVL